MHCQSSVGLTWQRPMRVIVARSNSFIPLKCKKSIHVVFHYRSPETARPSFHGNLRKAMPSRLCVASVALCWVVAFRRFRLSAAEFAANRRFKVQKRSQCFFARVSRESSHNATGQTRLHNALLRSPVACSRCHRTPDRYISANNKELSHASMLMESKNVFWIVPVLLSTKQ